MYNKVLALGSLALLALLSTANAAMAIPESRALEIKQRLSDAQVIPDLLPEDFMPQTELKIVYENNITVTHGTMVTKNETLFRPEVSFEKPNPDSQYALIAADIDAKSPYIRHWIASNIEEPTHFLDNTTEHQYTIYFGPKPRRDGRAHRYVFVLYEQAHRDQAFMPTEEEYDHPVRSFFNITDFVETNELTPIAASYMLAEHE